MDMLQAALVTELEALAASRNIPLDELKPTIANALVDILVKFYGTHIWPRSPSAANADMQFLLLIKPCPFGEECFMKVVETAVNIIDNGSYASIGIGSYLADYILANLHMGVGAKEYQLALAAYVMGEVNDNVDGCGHGYSIYHFDNEGKFSWMAHDYRREDFSEIKLIFRWAFQTMTDIRPEVDSFTADRIGEFVERERIKRTANLERELEMRARFHRFQSDKTVER
jgi:hypothetical protein